MHVKHRIIALLFASLGSTALLTAPQWVHAQTHYATSQAQNDYNAGINFERQAEQKGDQDYLEKALDAYKSAIQNDPNMVEAYARLGYLYYALQKSEEGVAILEDALKLHPNSQDIKHYLGLNLYQVGRVNEAQELLWNVVSQTDRLPEAYFILGKIALDNKDFDTAQGNFTHYIELSPKDTQGYRALSLVYIQKKDLSAAESTVEQLLALEPEDAATLVTMGNIKYELGKIEEAVDLYERVYKKDKKRVDLLYLIGSAYYLSGNYEKAIPAFERVLKENSRHLGALYFIADSYLKSERLDEAEASFKALLTQKPDYNYLRLKLAYILYLKGEKENADLDLKGALEKTDHLDDLNYGAILFRKMGKTEQAIQLHSRLFEENPDNANFGIMLARDQLELKEYTTAIDALSSVIEKDLHNTMAWELLSIAYLNQGHELMLSGELEQARASFDQANSLSIHSVESLCSLAQLALLEGNSEEAKEMLQLAKEVDATNPKIELLTAHLELFDGNFESAGNRLDKLAAQSNGELLGGTGWFLQAIAQSWTGEWEDAVQALDNADKLGVTSPMATSVLLVTQAMNAYQNGQFEHGDAILPSIQKYQEDLDVVDGIRFDYLLAASHIRKKKFSQARTLLEKVKTDFAQLDTYERTQITDTGALNLDFELAYCYVETGAYEQALKLIGSKKSKEFDSISLGIRRKLGNQAFKSEQYSQALSHFEEVSSLGGNDTADQHNLAVVKHMAGKLSNPAAQFEKFAKSGIPIAVLNYAIFLDEKGQKSESMKYYEKYASAVSGKRSEDVKKLLDVKTRVWGESTN